MRRDCGSGTVGVPGNQAGESTIGTVEQLRAAWSELDAHWDGYVGGLDEARLDEPVYKVSTSSGHGRRLATRRGDVLLHLTLHAQYTTAQAVNMLRQLGVSPLPDVMPITLGRRQHPENSWS